MNILRLACEWIYERWQRLVGLLTLIALINIVLIISGIALKSQILLALAVLIFSALGILLILRLQGLDKLSSVLVWFLQQIFGVDIQKPIKNPEVDGFVQQIWSVIAWLTILEIALATFYPIWTPIGSIILAFAIAFFGAAVVKGWGVDTSWVRTWAIRFSVVAFVLILTKMLWPDLSMKSVGKAWKSLTTSVSHYVDNKELVKSKERAPAVAQKQLNTLKQESGREASQLTKPSSVVPKRQIVFDSDYWRAKRELEAWRAQVNSP